jgi:hypothetical protein
MKQTAQELSSKQTQELLQTLQSRFEKNLKRHPNMEWKNVQSKIELSPQKLSSLFQMESTG